MWLVTEAKEEFKLTSISSDEYEQRKILIVIEARENAATWRTCRSSVAIVRCHFGVATTRLYEQHFWLWLELVADGKLYEAHI